MSTSAVPQNEAQQHQQAQGMMRSNSLAFAFQDVITVILRVRHRTQRVADAAAFRESISKMISAGAQEVRRLGYSDQTSQMALYAVIGFLDESVLNSQDPTFAAWARRPLQEEMFGGFFAGEYFFRHVAELLAKPESPEVADALELHAICLLLGFRGKHAFGDNGEIQSILQRIREKIFRIRGPLYLSRVQPAPAVANLDHGDRWVKRLVLATVISAAIALIAFAAYYFLLTNGINAVQTASSALTVQPSNAATLALSLAGAR